MPLGVFFARVPGFSRLLKQFNFPIEVSMLTSQTSSNSSLTSSNNGESKKLKHVPEKFKQSCVLSRKVFIDEPQNVTVIVTSRCELIECKEADVINYINLKCHVESILAKERICAEDVELEVILRDSGAVVYVLKVNSVLFGIERLPSQLILLKTLTKVKSFKYKLHELTNEILVHVTFDDNNQLLTSFEDDELEDFMRNSDSEQFSSILEYASKKTESARCQLDNITNQIEQMDLMMHRNLKMLPKLMLADVSQTLFTN